MKRFTFEEAEFLARPIHDIVPTKPKFWEMAVKLYEGRNHSGSVKYYESLGGRWTIETKQELMEGMPAIAEAYLDDDVSDIPDFSGIENTPAAKRWIKRMKKMDPKFYEKLNGWDQND
jgi:hypothetical protein